MDICSYRATVLRSCGGNFLWFFLLFPLFRLILIPLSIFFSSQCPRFSYFSLYTMIILIESTELGKNGRYPEV
jgi:hypothetical protein